MAGTKRKTKTPQNGESSFATEVVPVASLRPHPRNYREHPDDQLAHIVSSIRRHGFYRPIVTASDGTILAGHGVVRAAAKMGIEQVPIVRLKLGPDDPKALKLLAGDNEISHLGVIDDRILTDLLKDIKLEDLDEGLLGTGFDEKMLASYLMVTRSAEEIRDFDAAAHWAGMPEYVPAEKAVVLMVRFRSKEDREELLRQVGLDPERLTRFRQNDVWSTWWPPEENEKDDVLSVRGEQEA